ncbi:MAG: hypothetical protein ABSD63_01675 [Candidatus Korobacteraceae bacterium]|jgi:hypothetical protein
MLVSVIAVVLAALLLFCSASVAQSPSPSPKPSDPCPVFHHQNIPATQWDFYPSIGIVSGGAEAGVESETKDWKKSTECVKEWVAKACPHPHCSYDDQRRLEMCTEGLNDKDWCDALRKRLGVEASLKEVPHTPEKAK